MPGGARGLTEFGADLAIDTTQPDWSEEVLAATDKKGVDLIVDQVSASVANQNMKAAAVLGRIVNVGRLGGFKGEFDFDLHALKRIDYIGVTFRTRSRGGGARDRARHARRPVGRTSRAASSSCRSTAPSRSTRRPRALAHMRANAALRQDRAGGLRASGFSRRSNQATATRDADCRHSSRRAATMTVLTRLKARPVAKAGA